MLAPGEDTACERACPHEQADLGRGHVAAGRRFCPRHAASFDLRDGPISSGWPSPPLRLSGARHDRAGREGAAHSRCNDDIVPLFCPTRQRDELRNLSSEICLLKQGHSALHGVVFAVFVQRD
ncbi:Rieske 2Fe-2S domain-containing protein [Bradyrhizobium frederickii]|uniref:Rieske 2Fe-2S domain-containing protein n=1 Tax=Bradyrhizobium frederickii TaxID=2560054 RepID=UPI001F3FFE10|nr:Rieske 2Fe-2S domain-containing protein [Bradyrhizobium frederickii]